VRFAAIAGWADSDAYPVSFMCAQLGVSRSGYYEDYSKLFFIKIDNLRTCRSGTSAKIILREF